MTSRGFPGWAIVEQDVLYGKTMVPPVESMRASLGYLKNVVSNLGPANQFAATRA